MNDFGERLKKLRKKANITQSDLAEKLNVHVQTVSRWERDSSVPDMAIYGVLSNILAVSLEELWGLSAPNESLNGQFDTFKLGKAIAAERKRLNESQDVLANLTCVSSDTVSKWERGLICPDVDAFLTLAGHFAILPSALYYAQVDHINEEIIEQSVSPTRPKSNKRKPIIAGILSLFFLVVITISIVFLCMKSFSAEGAKTPKCDHQYELNVTGPTCTAQGYTTYTCTQCGDNYKGDYTEVVPHTPSEWITDKEPTCTQEGSKHTECEICRAKVATGSIEKLPHSYTRAVTDSTCTAQGYTTYTCSSCGDSYRGDYTEVIPHTPSEWITDKEPTCTQEGSKHTECEICRAKVATGSIEKISHSYKRAVIDPTCTAQGYTTYTCTQCGDNYKSDYTEVVPHTPGEWITDKEPTCTQEGSKHTECEICRAKVATESIANISHSYKRAVTDPTCTAQGYTTYTCTQCGDNYKGDYTAVAPHTPGAWITDREATCSVSGSRHKECAVCRTTIETVGIEKLEHSYSYVIVPPKDDIQGYYLYTCGLCGNTYQDNYFFEDESDLKFNFDYYAKTCAVIGVKDKDISKVTIPSVVNGCTVTKIERDAFKDCVILREVVIPDTVTEIGSYTFYRCALLEEIVIPDSVTEIGDEAFCGCRGMVRAVLPKGLNRIKYSTFSDCVNLNSVNIPSCVTVIEDLAFHNCPKLQDISLPEGLLTIGGYAFHGCEKLEEINIPQTVIRIGDNAFSGCRNLKSVIFGQTIGWLADEIVIDGKLLSDPRMATEYLTKKYYLCIWVRN